MNVTLIAPPWFEVPPRGHGGIETVVATLANALARRGHDVVVHAVGGSGLTVPARASFDEAQERYLGTPDRSAVELAHVVAAYRSIALEKPDVVHDHTGIVGAAAATTVPDVPVLCTIHKPLSPAFRRAWRLLAESPSIYVSVLSRDQRRRLDGDVPVDSVVSNGVDLDRFPVVREKQEYLVTISRICAEKAPHVAMEVARRAGQTLKIAGRVETTPEGRRYYAEEFEPRLGAGVEYLGEIGHDEKAELLGHARALLFPVEWAEPFGLVAVEALACGTPVVATPRGALPEIVVDGVHGFLREDPEGMLDAVGQLDAIDPDVCRQRVQDHFSAEVMAAAYEQVYERVVAAAGRRRASC